MLHLRTCAVCLFFLFWASVNWAGLSLSANAQPLAHSPVNVEQPSVPDADDTPGATQRWAIDVVVGEAHTCALSGGKVYCWGDNSSGQLGDGTTQQRNAPVHVGGLPSGVTAIAAGPVYSCAAATPFVWCWGAVMRDGVEEIWLSPRSIPFEGDIASIVALTAGTWRTTPWQTNGHLCALTLVGELYCWGSNDNGQLGNANTLYTDEPQLVLGIDRGATAVTAGNHHTCALVRGGMKCWGWNGMKQLGLGTDNDVDSSRIPVDVLGMEQDVIAIDIAANHSCALTAQHKIWCWGGINPSQSTPAQWDGSNSYWAFSSGIYQRCGQRLDGQLYCGDIEPAPEPVPDSDNYGTGLEVGATHSCYLTDNGGVKCWGRNHKGQLGMGTTDYQSTPVEPSASYTDVVGIAAQEGTYVLRADASVECFRPGDTVKVGGLAEGARAVSGQCAVTTAGGVKCWSSETWLAESVPGLTTGVAAVASQNYYSIHHTCALMETGGVKCWGSGGFFGECGNGTQQCSATPEDVVGLTENVQAIAVAYDMSCALMTGGKVKCWGDDRYRQQGDYVCATSGKYGEELDYCDLTPVDVVGLPPQVQEIALGGDSCVLTTSGEVDCWGDDVALSSGVKSITVGEVHKCALLESGGVQCWGNNDYGQVGNGVLGGQYEMPVDVVALDEPVAIIHAGAYHTCAVTESGRVRCWGRNDRGELGINTGQTPMDVLGFGVRDIEHHRLPWLATK